MVEIYFEAFVDLQKGFDTVDHHLAKINHYWVRGIWNDWFKFYLSNAISTYLYIDMLLSYCYKLWYLSGIYSATPSILLNLKEVN